MLIISLHSRCHSDLEKSFAGYLCFLKRIFLWFFLTTQDSFKNSDLKFLYSHVYCALFPHISIHPFQSFGSSMPYIYMAYISLPNDYSYFIYVYIYSMFPISYVWIYSWPLFSSNSSTLPYFITFIFPISKQVEWNKIKHAQWFQMLVQNALWSKSCCVQRGLRSLFINEL